MTALACVADRNEEIMTERTMTEERAEQVLQDTVEGFGTPPRSPVLHAPSEQGLDWENVTFPSRDGTPLEGWSIPVRGANSVVIANHPIEFQRHPERVPDWFATHLY